MVNVNFDGVFINTEKAGESGGNNVTFKTGAYDDNILKMYVKDKSLFSGIKIGDNCRVSGKVQTNSKGFTNAILKEIKKL